MIRLINQRMNKIKKAAQYTAVRHLIKRLNADNESFQDETSADMNLTFHEKYTTQTWKCVYHAVNIPSVCHQRIQWRHILHLGRLFPSSFLIGWTTSEPT